MICYNVILNQIIIFGAAFLRGRIVIRQHPVFCDTRKISGCIIEFGKIRYCQTTCQPYSIFIPIIYNSRHTVGLKWIKPVVKGGYRQSLPIYFLVVKT